MRVINRNNIEAWIVDYYDGTLSPSEQDQLNQFIAANPDLKIFLDNYEPVVLPQPNIHFAAKSKLKKNIPDQEHFNQLAVAYLEGDLDETDRKWYEELISQHPDLHQQHLIFQKTILQPDNNIVFVSKSKLKRNKGVLIPLQVLRYAAAACVLLVAGYLMFDKEQPVQQQANHINHQTPTQLPKEVTQHNQPDRMNRLAAKSDNHSVVPKATQSKVYQSNIQFAAASMERVVALQPDDVIAMMELKPAIVPPVEIPAMQVKPTAYIDNSYVLVMMDKPVTNNFEKSQEILREMAVKRLNHFALDTDQQNASQPKNKIKTLAIFGKLVKRITFDQVNIETTYNEQGNLMAYSITAGRYNFEKQVVK
jgi:anti-sigma factor RsiW